MNENRIDEPTTTHAAWGAGHPRLMVSSGDTRFVHEITTDRVRVGSSAENELVLRGCDPLHAEIEHDPRDEYVLTMHGAGEMNAKPVSMAAHPGERAEILRTGARFTAGPWTLVYMRDEFADGGPDVVISRALHEAIAARLSRGEQAKVFRSGVAPVQLYISIAGLCFFYSANIHTLGILFDRDLRSKDAVAERRAHVIDFVIGYLTNKAPAKAAAETPAQDPLTALVR